MKQIEFKNFEDYYEAQRRADVRKSPRVSATTDEIDLIIKHMQSIKLDPQFGVCHGVRYGHESRWFQERLPRCQVIGTDLLPREQSDVVKWDFHDVNPEWLHKFNFLYTNSFDHTHSPDKCAQVWMDQLKPRTGRAYINWAHHHINARGGDCLGAVLHEYIDVFNEAGVVKDLLFHRVNKRKCPYVVLIVVAPKP